MMSTPFKRRLATPLTRVLLFSMSLGAVGLSADLEGEAWAAPSAADRDTARALMDEGDKKLAAGDKAGALKSYRRAHEIMNVPTTGVEVAKVLESRGQLVEARDMYLEVMRHPRETGEPTAFTTARSQAVSKADALGKRIPSLKVVVVGPPDGAKVNVKIDKEVIPSASIGVPRKINPGVRTVIAWSDGYKTATTDVKLREGDNREIELKLEKGESVAPVVVPAPSGAGPQTGGPTSDGPVRPVPPPPADDDDEDKDEDEEEEGERRSTGLFVTGIVLMPIGGFALLLGGAGVAISASPEGSEEALGPSAAVMGAGVAVLVAGIVMTVVGGKRQAPQAAESANAGPSAAWLIPTISPIWSGEANTLGGASELGSVNGAVFGITGRF